MSQTNLPTYDFSKWSNEELVNLKKQTDYALKKREELRSSSLMGNFVEYDRVFVKYMNGRMRFGEIERKNYLTAGIRFDDGAYERVRYEYIRNYDSMYEVRFENVKVFRTSKRLG